MIVGHSFKTRVTMSDGEFCYFYDILSDLMKVINVDDTGQSYRYSDFCKINSKEYFSQNIVRMYFSFRDVYEKNIDLINEYIKGSRLDRVEHILESIEFDCRSSVDFDIEMDFQYWQFLFEITDYFNGVEKRRIEMNSAALSEKNDWSPPDNFKDGTDDEQEVWSSHWKNC